MGRGKTRVSNGEGVRREKVKGREKKWEILSWETEGTKKLCLSWLQTKIIFIGDVTHEREIVFQKKKKLENSLKKISLIFIRVFHWLKIVFHWPFFFFFFVLPNTGKYEKLFLQKIF